MLCVQWFVWRPTGEIQWKFQCLSVAFSAAFPVRFQCKFQWQIQRSFSGNSSAVSTLNSHCIFRGFFSAFSVEIQWKFQCLFSCVFSGKLSALSVDYYAVKISRSIQGLFTTFASRSDIILFQPKMTAFVRFWFIFAYKLPQRLNYS